MEESSKMLLKRTPCNWTRFLWISCLLFNRKNHFWMLRLHIASFPLSSLIGSEFLQERDIQDMLLVWLFRETLFPSLSSAKFKLSRNRSFMSYREENDDISVFQLYSQTPTLIFQLLLVTLSFPKYISFQQFSKTTILELTNDEYIKTSVLAWISWRKHVSDPRMILTHVIGNYFWKCKICVPSHPKPSNLFPFFPLRKLLKIFYWFRRRLLIEAICHTLSDVGFKSIALK